MLDLEGQYIYEIRSSREHETKCSHEDQHDDGQSSQLSKSTGENIVMDGTKKEITEAEGTIDEDKEKEENCIIKETTERKEISKKVQEKEADPGRKEDKRRHRKTKRGSPSSLGHPIEDQTVSDKLAINLYKA